MYSYADNKKQKFQICLDRDTEGKGTRKSSTIKNDGTSCSANWVFFFSLLLPWHALTHGNGLYGVGNLLTIYFYILQLVPNNCTIKIMTST